MTAFAQTRQTPLGDSSEWAAFFNPDSIAVIGASADPSRSGGRVMATLATTGYAGTIIPISPSQPSIGALRCYKTLSDAPGAIDLALICVAAERVPAAILACGERGVRAAIVFADGFSHSGLGHELRSAIDAAKAKSGLRVIGPNTIGNRVINSSVYTTIATDIGLPQLPGSIATIGQSGGLSIYFGSAYLKHHGIGSKYVIDTGGEFDVDAAECLDWVADDPEISCAALILEGCRDGRRLMQAVQRMTQLGKPVVFWKTGRSQASAAQIASHTGALAGQAQIFEEGLRSAGAIIVRDETEFVDALHIASARRIPKGRRIGAITTSGGYAIITLDAVERFGMELPAMSVPPTTEQKALLGPANFGNPFDVYALFGAGRRSFDAALQWMEAQPDIDTIVIWLSYGNMFEPVRSMVLPALADAVARTDKVIFCCGMAPPEFERQLRDLGVLSFEEPTRLVQALSLVAPKPAPKPVAKAPHAAKPQRAAIGGENARALLAGIRSLPQVATERIATPEQAVAAQARFGGKVFMKLEGDRILHKTELGGVLGPLDARDVPDAFARLADTHKALGDPSAHIVMQPFEQGIELAFGGFTDVAFGPSVMVASGGIFLEVMKDTTFAVAPVTVAQAREMILDLRGAALLQGARGKPPADIEAAAQALSDFSQFVADHGADHSEIDINPVVVREQGRGVVAVDALIIPAEGKPHE